MKRKILMCAVVAITAFVEAFALTLRSGSVWLFTSPPMASLMASWTAFRKLSVPSPAASRSLLSCILTSISCMFALQSYEK